MRRAVSILFAITLLLSSFCVFEMPVVAEQTNGPLYGDAYEDGSVNMKDCLAMRKTMANLSITINKSLADTNGDKKIDMKDVLIVRQHLASIILEITGGIPRVNRNEWVSALVKLFHMTVDSSETPQNFFNDVNNSDPYYRDLVIAREFGLIDTEMGGDFNPGGAVTRDFAVTTLNYCIGFIPQGENNNSIEDIELCSKPEDARIAIERKWLKLYNEHFYPKSIISDLDKSNMLKDAQKVLSVSSNNESTADASIYAVNEKTKKLDSNNIVNYIDEETITIKNETSLKSGDTFVVEENGIPCAYEVKSVTQEGDQKKVAVEPANGEVFTDINLAGHIGQNEMEYMPGQSVENGSEEDYLNSFERVTAVSCIGDNTKVEGVIPEKKISVKRKIGNNFSITGEAKISNTDVSYVVKSNYASVHMGTDLSASYGIEYNDAATSDTSKRENIDGIPLGCYGVPGIGNIEFLLDASVTISGKVNWEGTLNAGIVWLGGTDIRLDKNFQKKGFSVQMKGKIEIMLEARLGATRLPIVNCYVYGRVGACAEGATDVYVSGTPKACLDLAVYLKADVGAKVKIKIGVIKIEKGVNWNLLTKANSPIKLELHMEDGRIVDKCTRDKSRILKVIYNGMDGPGETIYKYDKNGRLLDDGSTVYSYDDTKRIITKTSWDVVYDYYDENGMIKKEIEDQYDGIYETYYDDFGNIQRVKYTDKSQTDPYNFDTIYKNVYNENNQILKIYFKEINEAEWELIREYSYDKNGRLVFDGENTYTYNDKNQLTSVGYIFNDRIFFGKKYTYDSKGRIKTEEETNGKSGTSTREYIYS